MSEPEGPSLFPALAFVGVVKAVRQEYRIFRSANGDHAVISPSNRGSSSFHMTIVSKAKAESLKRIAVGKSFTTASLENDPRVREAFGDESGPGWRFDILLALYALTASGHLDMRRSGRKLVFTPKGEK
ncbi:MAG: hypothetical protein HY296_05185 [Thaumarchaeota archaeon]|nr:hypothetical protein [Nitrososphaerota archaeon]